MSDEDLEKHASKTGKKESCPRPYDGKKDR